MPIEIRELVIKLTVEDANQGGSTNTANSNGANKDEIVEECVEKVLEILRNSQKER
jgi:hypothetical protein